jgi:hypothetical protein
MFEADSGAQRTPMLDEIGANARKRVVAICETAELIMATNGEDRSGQIGLQMSGRHQTEIGSHARVILTGSGRDGFNVLQRERPFRPELKRRRRLGAPRGRHRRDERGKPEPCPEPLSRKSASSRQNRPQCFAQPARMARAAGLLA